MTNHKRTEEMLTANRVVNLLRKSKGKRILSPKKLRKVFSRIEDGIYRLEAESFDVSRILGEEREVRG